MTTFYEHPSNGYRVQVSDGACFLWTLLFGSFFFLVRGSVRHFFIGLVLGALTCGISWLLYPFFAAGLLRTMYLERGYHQIDPPERSSSGVLIFSFVFLVLLAAGGALWWFRAGSSEVAFAPPPSDDVAKPASSAASQLTVAEAQREAMRCYPALGVADSPFNRAFLARYREYQHQRPEYFSNPSWPVTLAREIADTPLTSEPPRFRREQLVVVRGRVTSVQQGKVLVDCDILPSHGLTNYRLPAGAGAADSQRLATLAISQEQKEFGPLMIKQGNSLRAATFQPPNMAAGLVYLYDLSAAEQSIVNVIAAPATEGGYTTRFELAPEAPGSWMRQRRSNALESGSY